jgi:hypothetical protein
MASNQLLVRVDNRIRLMSAVLAVTDWPDRAQQRKGHRAHTHARNTTKFLQPFAQHPAVQGAQKLLNQKAPLEAFFAYALKLSWGDFGVESPPPWVPADWNRALGDFYTQTNLAQLWKQDRVFWEKAEAEASGLLGDVDFYSFLGPFLGPIQEQLVYMPNISYPSDLAVGVRAGGELICIGPPRIAWGDNEPWPFDEDPAHMYSSTLSEYARLLIMAYLRQNASEVEPITQKPLPVDEAFRAANPNWGDQFVQLFVAGCVAMYLEHKINQQEAKSFILMEKKLKGITVLPGVISVLERYLRERAEGKFEAFVEFLPFFPGHLRVANRVSSI